MTPTARTTDPRPSVDDYLGPGERRFFGQGYKRAEQRLTDITVHAEPAGGGTLRALVGVRYPADWSAKGSTLQRAHLSSVDVLLLAGEAAELHLTHTLGLDPADQGSLRLRRVRMKAGTSPVEDTLGAFPVTAALTAPTDLPGRPGRQLSAADCQVGALRVRCDIEHPAASPTARSAHYESPDELLGPAALRPFAAAHRGKRQHIDDLAVDIPGRRAGALLSATSAEPPGTAVRGLESHSHAGTSILDVFVATIQLGQILLYGLDAVSRADSNTLWMRRTTLDIADPYRPVPAPATVTVRLDDAQLLARDGHRWRSAEITGELAHLSVRCAAAHRLP